MFELIIEANKYFKIDQTKHDYFLINLIEFTLFPGHTKLETYIDIIFDEKFLCHLTLEHDVIRNGIIKQTVTFPENKLTLDLVNLKNIPFFVPKNTKIATFNFTVKQPLDTFFLYPQTNQPPY